MATSLAAPPTTRARILLFLAAVAFGLSALCVRFAARAGTLSGEQVSFARFAIGLVLVSAIFVRRPALLRPRNYPGLAVRGLVGGLSGMLYFKGLALIPAGQATLLNNTFPVWAVLLSFLVLRERPTLHILLALLVATAGVFLVVRGGETELHLGMGQLLALLSGVCGGVAVTAIRALRADHNAPTIFLAFSLGGVLISSPALLEPWGGMATVWVAVLTGGVSAFLAQLFMTEAYGALSVAEAAVWQQLTPIASFVWALGLDERVTKTTLVGVTLGVAGIVYATVLGQAPSRVPGGA